MDPLVHLLWILGAFMVGVMFTLLITRPLRHRRDKEARYRAIIDSVLEDNEGGQTQSTR